MQGDVHGSARLHVAPSSDVLALSIAVLPKCIFRALFLLCKLAEKEGKK